jgi:hypothetical protein
MKMTVVTDQDGNIVAAHYGEVSRPDSNAVTSLPEFRAGAGLMAGPGQQLQVLDVPDTIANITSSHELEEQLKAALRKS